MDLEDSGVSEMQPALDREGIPSSLRAEAAPVDTPVPEAALPPEPVPMLERLFLRRLQRGDAKAFRELVLKHQDRVFSMSLRMLGDRREAEDLSQEVFLAVHRHIPRFRGQCRLSTWLYRITRNHCLNRLKYLEKRESDELTDQNQGAEGAGEAELPLVTSSERPDRALLGAEERQQVHTALQRLSTEHRLLVVLRDIEGLSYEEIARVADVPEGTVKSRLHRARAALADLLEAAGMAPDQRGGAEG
jgi:RNA polymerase sigma-70 factor (ECF subfamily)